MKRIKIVSKLFLIGFILMSGMLFLSGSAAFALEGYGFAPMGPGLHVTPLYAGQTMDAGTVSVWNSRDNLQIQAETSGGWLISEIQIYVGTDPVPTRQGNPVPAKFSYKTEYASPTDLHLLVMDLQDDLGFNWGLPWENLRVQNMAVHADLVQLDAQGEIIAEEGAWAFGPTEFEGAEWGWWFTYEMAHPQRGHFIDAPVGGVSFSTPTGFGVTDEAGGFDYFPGERVALSVGSVYLGSPLADQKISPLDIFESADTDDPRVINMARFLQSLDADGEPQSGIMITDPVVSCLNTAMDNLGYEALYFTEDGMVEDVIEETVNVCYGVEGITLAVVSAEDAIENLEKSLDSIMFRKNASKTPELVSSKSKLAIMGVWFPALKANGEDTVVDYYDENGALIRTAEEAKPIVVAYTDGIPETGYEDIFAAISRDDGKTFKRMNLSRTADKSSFVLANGQPYFGESKKPVVQVQDNNILVAWTSKFCNSGQPAYSISLEDDYIYDDPYYKEDIWGVGGPQRSVDYAELDHPEVGEIPYSCVWVARGTIVTQSMINSGGFWADHSVGEIVWFKPERLTSGRRDANQIFAGGSSKAGFAIAWQEDPEGLMPGSAEGPGEGWSGATTNHKTDIWYSFITMVDFSKVDVNFVSGGEPLHEDPEIVGRPQALVPMSMPVRLSDNDIVSTDNMMVELGEDGYPLVGEDGNWIRVNNLDADGDGSGTHAYGHIVDGLCTEFYEFINEQGVEKKACITADQRLLDGDTGASRPNLSLQTYKKPDGTISAWAIVAYEETKGLGGGNPLHTAEGEYGDDYKPEEGKNVIYHSFDFQNPDVVSAGNIVNQPETDAAGNLVYIVDEFGTPILDFLGNPQLAYENARRPRFVLQGKSGIGKSRTIMVILYKEGEEGHGRPSDIMMRRVVVPITDKGTDNPYRFANFLPEVQNVSTVTPIEVTESTGDPLSEDPWGAVKVVRWQQTEADLGNRSGANPYEDARAHRGALSGDFLVIGYTYTPNWGAYRNGNDKYDFFVRRSFDGGASWTTDPDGSGVTTCDVFTDPLTKEKMEVCNTYAPGQFEQARNVSQLSNNKTSVIEPRIVKTPGTIKNPDGTPTGNPEDINNPNVFYLSFGTANNVPPEFYDDEGEYATPLDIFYSFTTNRGENYVEVAWNVNPDSDGNYAGETVYRWASLAIGDYQQGEAQLRMTPDGSRFYATWLEEGYGNSDIQFRRIMSPEFDANIAK